MNEQWKDVLGFEGLYQVSNIGNVRTVARYYFSGRGHKNKKYIPCELMSVRLNNHGYYDAPLRNGKKRRPYTIHRLVYEAFMGKIPEGLVINHKDLDKTNNKISNLEAISIRDNNIHYVKSLNMKCSSLGVNKIGNGFSAQIHFNKRRIYLGYFNKESEGARFYDMALSVIENGGDTISVMRRSGVCKFNLYEDSA